MGKVFSLINYRNTQNSIQSEIRDQTDLMWNYHNASNARRRNLLNPKKAIKIGQVIHVDFKNKRKVA